MPFGGHAARRLCCCCCSPAPALSPRPPAHPQARQSGRHPGPWRQPPPPRSPGVCRFCRVLLLKSEKATRRGCPSSRQPPAPHLGGSLELSSEVRIAVPGALFGRVSTRRWVSQQHMYRPRCCHTQQTAETVAPLRRCVWRPPLLGLEVTACTQVSSLRLLCSSSQRCSRMDTLGALGPATGWLDRRGLLQHSSREGRSQHGALARPWQ
jgi:hypothetical protein